MSTDTTHYTVFNRKSLIENHHTHLVVLPKIIPTKTKSPKIQQYSKDSTIQSKKNPFI